MSRTSIINDNKNCGLKSPTVFIVIFIILFINVCRANPTDTTDRPRQFNTPPVLASILVADAGPKIYQAGGHAAIRLQCPACGIDNVFSYETGTGDILTQLLGQAHGRFTSLALEQYLNIYRAEGRTVTSYPLNLTDSQTHDLWRILDKSVSSDISNNFNLRHNNCNSNVFAKITEALGKDTIIIDDKYLSMTNGALQRHVLNNRDPWSAALFNVGTGSAADDTDHWTTRTVPLIMGDFLDNCQIISSDGSCRPMLANHPTVLFNGNTQRPPSIFTPTTVAILLLLVTIIISWLDYNHRLNNIVFYANCLLLLLQTCGALLLLILAIIPASISSGWNWMFVPFNIFPAIVWMTARHRPLCRLFFISYGIACAIFALAPLWTDQASTWTSLVSVAISLRTLSHYYTNTIP